MLYCTFATGNTVLYSAIAVIPPNTLTLFQMQIALIFSTQLSSQAHHYISLSLYHASLSLGWCLFYYTT